MIKINLLAEGKRAVTRKAKAPAITERRELGGWLLLAGFVLGLATFGALWFYLRGEIKQKDVEIAEAQAEVNELQAIIDEVEDFKRKKAELEHKIHVIKTLKENQRGPVRIMDYISRALPELVWLDSMSVGPTDITLQGQAFNTNAVANFIENLDKVPEFDEPFLRDTRQAGPVYSYVIGFGYSFEPEPPTAAAAPAPPPGG